MKWLQEFEAHPNISSSRDTTAGDNMKSATTATRRPFPLKKLLRPKSATTTSVSGAATAASADDDITPFDVDSMAVVESKRHTSDPATGGTSVHIDRDSFLDSRAGTTNIGADKLVELREAAPFIWAGRSPFWSPLVLQRCVLEPIRDLLDHVSPEKVRTCCSISVLTSEIVQRI